MKRSLRLTSLLLLPLLAAGCQTNSPVEELLRGRQIDYTHPEHQERLELQYPPDLLSGARGVEGTVSLSEYKLAAIPKLEEKEVAVDAPASQVTYRREGNVRWVHVALPPNEAWQSAQRFWRNHLGFELEKENAQLGTMETAWLDIRESIATPGPLGEYVDGFLNRLNDSGQRDKFTTRLERNESGGSDIFIAHRHIVAEFDKDGQFSGYANQESDAQLEVEMLRRLMLYLAGRDLAAADGDLRAQVAAQEAAASGAYQLADNVLTINKPYRESWQLVQVALNRGGFSVEDRNYDQGVIYIRHSGGPGSDKIFGEEKSSWLTNWFQDEKPVLRTVKLLLQRDGQATRLTSEAPAEEEALTAAQTAVVLQLVHQYLP